MKPKNASENDSLIEFTVIIDELGNTTTLEKGKYVEVDPDIRDSREEYTFTTKKISEGEFQLIFKDHSDWVLESSTSPSNLSFDDVFYVYDLNDSQQTWDYKVQHVKEKPENQ